MQADAIVFRQANTPTLESIDLPTPEDDDLVIRTVYSGISIGTEQSIFSGRRTENGTFPLIGGYMSSGFVEQVGANASGFNVGDRVVVNASRPTAEVNSIFGGHASMRIAAAQHVFHVPDGLDMAEASMFILPRVGLNAINGLNINKNDTVVIQGQGLIGQFFGQWASARGACVVTIEPDPRRAELSRKYVSEHVIDPRAQEPAAAIDDITAGRGPDYVVEATGVNALIPHATRLLRTRSQMVFLAWYDGQVAIDYHHHFHANEVTAHFPMGAGNAETAHAVLDAMRRGTIRFGDNMTDIVSADEACDLYQRIIDGDRSIMGATIQWQEV